jgi:hypothetical protein
MCFVIEARHAVVGLRFEIRPDDPMLGVGGEERQATSRNEVADEGRNENGFTGAGETGDAETYGRRQVIAESGLCILDEIRVGKVSQVMPRVIAMKRDGWSL